MMCATIYYVILLLENLFQNYSVDWLHGLNKVGNAMPESSERCT